MGMLQALPMQGGKQYLQGRYYEGIGKPFESCDGSLLASPQTQGCIMNRRATKHFCQSLCQMCLSALPKVRNYFLPLEQALGNNEWHSRHKLECSHVLKFLPYKTSKDHQHILYIQLPVVMPGFPFRGGHCSSYLGYVGIIPGVVVNNNSPAREVRNWKWQLRQRDFQDRTRCCQKFSLQNVMQQSSMASHPSVVIDNCWQNSEC